MKPICQTCLRFFKPTKNGIRFVEGKPDDDGVKPPALPGHAEPHRWSPYKVWMGDQWTCPGCHAVIIVGTGLEPVSIEHMPNFENSLEWASHPRTGVRLQINDC